LNVVIPWDERTFQFTSKQNCLPALGIVRLGAREVQFAGAQSFACLDYGRGIWPRDCRWNWGSASGRQNGRTIGLNLGGQWTDGTGSTENGVCVDGRLYKISSDLAWAYSSSDFMQPWRIQDPAGALDLTFSPRSWNGSPPATSGWCARKCTRCLAITRVGSAPVTSKIPIDPLVGWAEDHIAVW
jgi:hypothetical protein